MKTTADNQAEPHLHRVTRTDRSLRLLSYNFQTGVETQHYRDYVTKSWKHLVPSRERLENLNRIADLVKPFDLVGLQEVDSGSLRTGFVHQTEYLAHRAGFPFWFSQVNRNLGRIAQHSNGLLSHIRPVSIDDHKLPGLPGRGAILATLETSAEPIAICIIHLSLGRRARAMQLAYLTELMREYTHLVVMGDFNCGYKDEEMRAMVDGMELQRPSCDLKTYPSWRPMRRLDHILVSPSLTVASTEVINYTGSDHLPVCTEIQLPAGVRLRT